MTTVEIILISLILIITIILVFFILILFAKRPFFTPNKGKVMFELDIKKREFKYLSHKSMEHNKIAHTQKISGLYSTRWQPFSKFIKLFSDQSIKLYREGIHDLENSLISKYNFKATVRNESQKNAKHKNNNIEINVSLNKTSGNIVHATFAYKIINKNTNIEIYKAFNANRLANIKAETTILLMFDTNAKHLDKIPQIVFLIKKHIKYKNIVPTIYKGRLIIIFPTSNTKKLSKKIERSIKNISSDILETGLRSICSAGGYIIIDTPKTPKKISDAIIQLEYLLFKSSKSKSIVNFKQADLDPYKAYKEAFVTIEQATRISDIEFKTTKVKNFDTLKPLIEFGYPTIANINPALLKKVLTINYLRKMLIDSHINAIEKKSIDKPIIIDVNLEWLIKNYKDIKNKNIIYTFDISDIINKKSELLAIMAQLQDNKIFCGVRVRKLNISIFNFIEKALPKFVIMDHKISSKIHEPETYLQVINFNKTIKKKGIKIIFETPSIYIDQKQIQEISLNFFYNYK